MGRNAAFSALRPGARISGLVPGRSVTVVAATPVGDGAVTVVYRDDSGVLGDRIVYEADAAALVVEDGQARPFDGDGALFRLAAEALRIKMAGQFDPMLAVHTSDLEPLPHQIKAVYGELLPRIPLRFLLADDPGAGKTIMAGLFVKELALRGDLTGCLIVTPGGLVEQWQDELRQKFDVHFDLLTRDLAVANVGGTLFDRHPLLIARMDQLSRNDDLMSALSRTRWDLVVVDEAHRMSAHYFGRELKRTRRYELGQMLGRITRHLLLLTATPHSGKNEDYQLFLALLDPDRFEGKFRRGDHSTDASGLTRRMVKEELLTVDGRRLFPERKAITLAYPLSSMERELYDAVTEYVRKEWDRADSLKETGDTRTGVTVGFALTVLQRRLASSPEAILRSLERRRRRLEQRRHEVAYGALAETESGRRLADLVGTDGDIDADLEELDAAERETIEEDLVDAATAARTRVELEAEIAILADLEALARNVRHSGTDRKWTELRELLHTNQVITSAREDPRKIIIFTEHRDTLRYLLEKIRALIGRDDAVEVIHGGVNRVDRRRVQDVFMQDRECVILVATDAAGEGLNLQRAHLMVNYDLPWNPNRIEQRFGRIHRIGQTETCHLWNLVAADTREGDVFHRLFVKLDEQSKALGGKVFDMLGQAFEAQPLRKLLVEAIRYGDLPERREWLTTVIDTQVGEGLAELVAERALHHDPFTQLDLDAVRQEMEEAQARRLQPHYIKDFFMAAFAAFGGRMSRREAGRWEITHVPAELRGDNVRRGGLGGFTLRRYERACFERDFVQREGRPRADLLAPGHALLDAVVDAVIDRHGELLRRGAVLVDRRDVGESPWMLVALTQQIVDGHVPPQGVSRQFDFVEVSREGAIRTAGAAPYLDYHPPSAEEVVLIDKLRKDAWLVTDVERQAEAWAIEHGMATHLAAVRARVNDQVAKTRSQVRQRLTKEINYWYGRQLELQQAIADGKPVKRRPESAERTARELEQRLERRMSELERENALQSQHPVIAGAALIVPQGLLDRLAGERDQPMAHYAKDTAAVERRAINAVLAAERALGREPTEMPHNNPGFDILSIPRDAGTTIEIEVKGRIAGSDDFFITRTEVLRAKNIGDRYRLALVAVHPDGPDGDEVRYVENPFVDFDFGDFAAYGTTGKWHEMWARGGRPW